MAHACRLRLPVNRRSNGHGVWRQKLSGHTHIRAFARKL
jgi:hypothetical protein